MASNKPRKATAATPSGGFPHWMGNEVRRMGVHIHDAAQFLKPGGTLDKNVEGALSSGWSRMTNALFPQNSPGMQALRALNKTGLGGKTPTGIVTTAGQKASSALTPPTP